MVGQPQPPRWPPPRPVCDRTPVRSKAGPADSSVPSAEQLASLDHAVPARVYAAFAMGFFDDLELPDDDFEDDVDEEEPEWLSPPPDWLGGVVPSSWS